MKERNLRIFGQLAAAGVLAASAIGLKFSADRYAEIQDDAGETYSTSLDLHQADNQLSLGISSLERSLNGVFDSRSSISNIIDGLPPETDVQEEIAAIQSRLASINTDTSEVDVDTIKASVGSLQEEIRSDPDYGVISDVQDKQLSWTAGMTLGIMGGGIGLISSVAMGVWNIASFTRRKQNSPTDSSTLA